MLYICKGYIPLSTYKNIWLQRLVLHQCPNFVFFFWSHFGGKNDSCDGKKDYGFANVAQSCIYNNCDNKFWSLDV